MAELELDPARCALVIQDMQNDVIIAGGAFADSGAPSHAIAQNVVANVAALAGAARAAGVPVLHVWYIVEDGARGLALNAPLFQGVKDTGALVRGTWGAAPAEGESTPLIRIVTGALAISSRSEAAPRSTRVGQVIASQ